jgi:hypothetical protein
MASEHVTERLPDFWAGTLSADEHRMVESHLERCDACREEATTLGELWNELAALDERVPSDRMQARFDAMLSAYHEGVQRFTVGAKAPRSLASVGSAGRTLMAAAASVVLLVAGFAAGAMLERRSQPTPEMAELRHEVQNMRQMLTLSLLQQQSASDRLRGVTWSAQLEQANPEVLGALLSTLMHDSSVNVRLSALDALRTYSNEAVVRQGLVESLGRAQAPLIQIALIDLLVEIRERQSVETLRTLAMDPMLNMAVRERVDWGLKQLL